MTWRQGSAGVEEQGTCTDGVSRNLGPPSVSSKMNRGGEAGRTSPRPVGAALRVYRERRAERRRVPPSEGNEARRDGCSECGAAHSTDEAGEPAPGDPVEERGGQIMAPLEGTMQGTQSSKFISPGLQRIAAMARDVYRPLAKSMV